MQEKKISIVIPLLNEQDNLEEIIFRLKSQFQKLNNFTFEIIFIDDGSTDNSWKIVEKISSENDNIFGFKLSRNFGHQLAITAGLEKSSGDAIIIMDADLQDPPEVILQMIEKWQKGFKVVYGKRKMRKGESRFKIWTAAVFYKLINRLSDTPIPLDAGDFRLMDRQVVNELLRLPERNRFVRGLVSWVGFKQTTVEYIREERFSGKTKYPLSRMISFALDGITAFSKKPLQIAMKLGIFSIFIGLVMVIYVLISKIYYPETTISGWASMLITVVFFGGVQLLTLGIIGEYLGRIYDESKKRPLFIIEKETGGK